MIDYMLAILSIIGMYYNAKGKLIKSYIWWTAANVAWAVYYIAIIYGILQSPSLWGAVLLMVVYLTQDIYYLAKMIKCRNTKSS